MQNKICGKLIGIEAANFKSKKDKKAFEDFAIRLFEDFSSGFEITAFYNKEGKLMSFMVDSEKTAKILKKEKEMVDDMPEFLKGFGK